MITVKHRTSSVAADLHCNTFWNACIHEVSDSRPPQVVNKKPRIFIPRMTVFLLGFDQCSRSLSASTPTCDSVLSPPYQSAYTKKWSPGELVL